jgi:hypothetical protein
VDGVGRVPESEIYVDANVVGLVVNSEFAVVQRERLIAEIESAEVTHPFQCRRSSGKYLRLVEVVAPISVNCARESLREAGPHGESKYNQGHS